MSKNTKYMDKYKLDVRDLLPMSFTMPDDDSLVEALVKELKMAKDLVEDLEQEVHHLEREVVYWKRKS